MQTLHWQRIWHRPRGARRQAGGFRRSLRVALLALLFLLPGGSQKANAEFLNLDTIASWGKFPRFCINTYRWGDHFFNNYDSTYVQGSGYRFNIKVKTDSWLDTYNFRMTDGYRMSFESRPSTSIGLWLTYMAVSVGYDMNVSKYFNADLGARKRFDLQFNCSLFAFEYYSVVNDAHMKINRVGYSGDMHHVHLPFHGFHSDRWGLNLYYFFNHRQYSQAAAFSYSKIQMKSAGSFYAGLAYWEDKFDLDFTDVFLNAPDAIKLPAEWNNHYAVSNRNYALKLGYAYNWVFHRGWCLGVSEAPTIGVRVGHIVDPQNRRTTFALSNRARLSIIYNRNKRWFFGLVGMADTGLVYDKEHTFLANNLSLEASAGFRFNLW